MGKKDKKRKLERKKQRLLEKLQLDKLEGSVNPPVDINAKDEKRVCFSFFYADENKMTLSEWDSKEIDFLVDKLGYYHNYTWNKIRIDKSKFDYINQDSHLPTLPQKVPKDIKLAELKIGDKKRVIGFIDEDGIFCMIWFDRNHKTCD